MSSKEASQGGAGSGDEVGAEEDAPVCEVRVRVSGVHVRVTIEGENEAYAGAHSRHDEGERHSDAVARGGSKEEGHHADGDVHADADEVKSDLVRGHEVRGERSAPDDAPSERGEAVSEIRLECAMTRTVPSKVVRAVVASQSIGETEGKGAVWQNSVAEASETCEGASAVEAEEIPSDGSAEGDEGDASGNAAEAAKTNSNEKRRKLVRDTAELHAKFQPLAQRLAKSRNCAGGGDGRDTAQHGGTVGDLDVCGSVGSRPGRRRATRKRGREAQERHQLARRRGCSVPQGASPPWTDTTDAARRAGPASDVDEQEERRTTRWERRRRARAARRIQRCWHGFVQCRPTLGAGHAEVADSAEIVRDSGSAGKGSTDEALVQCADCEDISLSAAQQISASYEAVEEMARKWLRHELSEAERAEAKSEAAEVQLARQTAAIAVQNWWRAQRPKVQTTSIERGWRKSSGPLVAHVKFLQWVVRHTLMAGGWKRDMPPGSGCWRRGALRGPLAVTLAFGRRKRQPRCDYGRRNAGQHDFAAQEERAKEVLEWYMLYVRVLQRLEGRVTRAVYAFSGAGGTAEGGRRAGGSVLGTDLRQQSEFQRRFGNSAFEKGDSTCREWLRELRDRTAAEYCQLSPPCKFYSTALTGTATEPPLIGVTREVAKSLFRYYNIENVLGAAWDLGSTVELDGALFGLRVLRSRLFEANFPIVVDSYLSETAQVLRSRCCLGARRRWKTVDEFGRAEKPCCAGNVFCVVGKSPLRCTTAECAEAMGVDSGHMSYERLAQSVPPAYEQLIFAQMCMRRAHVEYGAPIWTFDAARADPRRACNEMSQWLRGAGSDAADAGLRMMPALAAEATLARRAATAVWRQEHKALTGGGALEAAAWMAPTQGAESLRRQTGLTATEAAEARPGNDERSGMTELAFTELFYTHAGLWDVLSAPSVRLEWLSKVSAKGTALGDIAPGALLGKNAYVELEMTSGEDRVREVARRLKDACEAGGAGTRATLVAAAGMRDVLVPMGFERLECLTYGLRPIDRLSDTGLEAWTVGRRRGAAVPHCLRHDDVRKAMDVRDANKWKPRHLEKAALTWTRMPHDAERWRSVGLPEDVVLMMTEGASVELADEAGSTEIKQYPWESGGMFMKGALECDRALEVGAMEEVPLDEVTTAMERNVVHPWLVVDQGGGKFRACHDYKRGTNVVAKSAHFGLPTAFDVRRVVKPGSYFAKYDLRDGFWAVPIKPEHRNRLMMRHPVTRRLLRCARLPFGYVDSPRKFCKLTESLADVWRKRVADGWVIDGERRYAHILGFVDDFLVCGDCEEATRRGSEAFEELMEEVGITWAPHKQRGPCECIEFLGLLLSNVPGHRCIALPEDKQRKTEALISEWMERRPAASGELEADPHDVARLLGKMVFASQVVPGGRTYMQGMMSQFAGLEVDWVRGRVALRGGAWGSMKLSGSFWRDLEWWQDNLRQRNCVPMDTPERSAAAVQTAVLAGTDASDFGSGQTVWIDGQRSEARVVFSAVEKGRPINWRELRGIVHVVEVHGPELAGCRLLIETDNMAAKGAAEKLASSAEAMQELVRRLLELCEEYDIQLRVTHTPGEKLDRPDQTSRGDSLEETRVRLTESAFEALASRYGPFTDLVGGERQHARSACGSQPAGGSKWWLHPAHSTVGSALRLAGEEMGRDGDSSGLVVVPHDERAGWWSMLRHFQIVGRLPAGGAPHLEACRLGHWQAMRSTRPSLILAFPRQSGARMQPLWLEGGRGAMRGVGYVPVGENFALAVLKGELVYAPEGSQRDDGAWRVTMPRNPGVLYIVADWVRPAMEDDGREAWLEVGAEVMARWPADGGWYEAVVERVAADGSYDVQFMDGDSRDSVPREEVRPQMTRVADEPFIRPELTGAGPWVPLMVVENTGNAKAGDRLWEVKSEQIHWEHASCLWTAGAMAVDAGGGPSRGGDESDGSFLGRSFYFDWKKARDMVCEVAQRAQDGWKIQWPLDTPLSELWGDEGEIEAPPSAESELAKAAQSAEEAIAIKEDTQRRMAEGQAKAAEARAIKEAVQAKKTQDARAADVKETPTRPKQKSMAPGAKCDGCGNLIGVGALMVPVGAGMAHNSKRCVDLAVAAFEAAVEKARRAKKEKATNDATKTKETTLLGSKEGVTQARRLNETEARISTTRCCKALQCLLGDCKHQGAKKMQCSTCYRGVHLKECLMVGEEFEALGRLKCTLCRVRSMKVQSCAMGRPMLLRETGNMLMELESGAPGTAMGAARLVSLMEEWCHEMYGPDFSKWPVKAVKMPLQVEDAAISFLRWVAHEKAHVTSVEQLVRTMGSIKSGEDVAKSERVKRCVKQLKESTGAHSQPRTSMTSALLRVFYSETLPKLVPDEKRLARDLVVADIEMVGGNRVGEATGSRHGLQANSCCLAKAIDSATLCDGKLGDDYEWVQLELLDSKTKEGRFVCMAGKTRGSGIEVAAHFRALWAMYDLKIEAGTEGGCVTLRPNYWVVRVALSELSEKKLNVLLVGKSDRAGTMPSCMDEAVIKKYTKAAMARKTGSSDEKYVNVAGGASDGSELKVAMAWLKQAGLASAARLEPGPLIRSTHGKRWTHMPWSTASTYSQIVAAMRAAHAVLEKRGVADPELELGKRGKPAFGNHSARRYADKLAQRYKSKTLGELLGKDAVTWKVMIDYYFGWKLTEIIKDMQQMYAGKDMIDRAELSLVTIMA